MRPQREYGPARSFLTLLLLFILITYTNSQTSQRHLVCKKPGTENCLSWIVYLEDIDWSNIPIYCGVSDKEAVASHNKFIEVAQTEKLIPVKKVFCYNVIVAGLFFSWKEVENAIGIPLRVRRQSFIPRGRYRGQTQSQYLAIDSGNNKDEGRAEALSAADSSRASVSGNSGMGQAQSQSVYDPNCDDCYGKPKHEIENLKRPIESKQGVVENSPNSGSTWSDPGRFSPTYTNGGGYNPSETNRYIPEQKNPNVYNPTEFYGPDGNQNGGNLQSSRIGPIGQGTIGNGNSKPNGITSNGYSPGLYGSNNYKPSDFLGTNGYTPSERKDTGSNFRPNGNSAKYEPGTNIIDRKYTPSDVTGFGGTRPAPEANGPLGGGFAPNNNLGAHRVPGGGNYALSPDPNSSRYDPRQGETQNGKTGNFPPQNGNGQYVTGQNRPYGGNGIYEPGYTYNTNSMPGVSEGGDKPGSASNTAPGLLLSQPGGQFGPGSVINSREGGYGPDSRIFKIPNEFGGTGATPNTNWPLASGPYPVPGGNVYCCVIPNNVGSYGTNRPGLTTSSGFYSPGNVAQQQYVPGRTGDQYGPGDNSGTTGKFIPGSTTVNLPRGPFGQGGSGSTIPSGQYEPDGTSGTTGPRGQYGPGGTSGTTGPGGQYGPGGSGGTTGPGRQYGPGSTSGTTVPGGQYGPGGSGRTTGPGGQYGPGSTSGTTGPGGQYGPGSTSGTTGPGGQYGPGSTSGTTGPEGQYGPGGSGRTTGPGGQYGPSSTSGTTGPGEQYGPGGLGRTTGPGGQYGPGSTSGTTGPGGQYGPGGSGRTTGPGGQYEPGSTSGTTEPEGQYGPGGSGGTTGPGGQYGPGGTSGTLGPGGQYGPGGSGGTTGPEGQYGPGGTSGTTGREGQYGPGSSDGTTVRGGQYGPTGSGGNTVPGGLYGPGGSGPTIVPGEYYGPGGLGGSTVPGGQYGPGSSGGSTVPGGQYGPDSGDGSTGGQYSPGGTGQAMPRGNYRPGGSGGATAPAQYKPDGGGSTSLPGGQYGPNNEGITVPGGHYKPDGTGHTTVPGGQYGPGGSGGAIVPGGQYGPSGSGGTILPGAQFGPGGSGEKTRPGYYGLSGKTGPEGQYGPGNPDGTIGPGGQYRPGGTFGTTRPGEQYGPGGSGGNTVPGGLYGPGGSGGTNVPGGQYLPGDASGTIRPEEQYEPGSSGRTTVPGGQYGSGGSTIPGGQYGPNSGVGTTGPIGQYIPPGGTGGTTVPVGQYGPNGANGYKPGSGYDSGISGGEVGTAPNRVQFGTQERPNGAGGYGTNPNGYYNQRIPTEQKTDYNGVPQNYLDPNSISTDGDDSEAEANVAQTINGTTASASSKGGNDKGRAQTSVQGTYTGSGSFQAQAQITGENKEAQSEVSGGKKGASSSATGSGKNNKSQANVQLGSETGSVQTQSQSNGIMHSSNSQVQGSVKGGMADAQARGPGSTSSQAQIGFTPYKDDEKTSHDLQRIPFTGGGMASAQSSGRTGQSQSQLHGTFKYGITYNGAAQSGASLDKDTVFPNRLSFDKIDVFDNKNKNININKNYDDATDKSQIFNTETPTSYTSTISEIFDTTETTEIPTVTDNVINESMKKSESRYSSHTHLDHHTTDPTNATNSNQPTLLGNRRSFQANYGMIPDYEFTTDKEDTQPEYDTDVAFEGEGNEASDVEQNEYSNYDEYSRDTHQYLQSSNKKGLEVQQTTGGSTQHIILGSLKDHNAEIIQKDTERPDESKVYQPGERVPGTGGYTIPIGFTGSVKSVASKAKTYVVGSQDSPSQAQTVTLTPGTGKIKYMHPSSYGKYVKPKNLRSLKSPKENENNRYVSVSKSVTRDLDSDNNIRKQYSHTYYTKSSSCGYFTFTCTMVSSAEGRKKVCKPKIPTNADGSPIRC